MKKVGLTELVALIAIMGAIVSAGMWFGRLEQRLSELERLQRYSHGDLRAYVPAPKE